MRLPLVRLVRWISRQRSQRYIRNCQPERRTTTSASSSERYETFLTQMLCLVRIGPHYQISVRNLAWSVKYRPCGFGTHATLITAMGRKLTLRLKCCPPNDASSDSGKPAATSVTDGLLSKPLLFGRALTRSLSGRSGCRRRSSQAEDPSAWRRGTTPGHPSSLDRRRRRMRG